MATKLTPVACAMMVLLLSLLPLLAWAGGEQDAKDARLSGDGPYVMHCAGGSSPGVRVITVTPQGQLRDTTYASLPENFALHVADHEGRFPFDVTLHPIVRPEWRQPQPEKVFVMSDPHGRLDLVVSLLQNNGVIGHDLRWAFGANHLVVIGDIFDRGPDVTQIFWLFYKLEAEAASAGGAVSVMLGNHEPMELAGDMRYAKPKYKLLQEQLGMPYRSLFGPDTELGRWLAKRNTMQIVGHNLFVHAGISHELYDLNMPIPALNDTISSVLFMKSKERKAHSALCKLLYGNRGPVWYRGLVLKDKKWSPLPADSLEMVLRRHDASRIFVGHTIFKDIRRFYKGKVIAVNVDNKRNHDRRSGRAVLIDSTGVYVVGDKGYKPRRIAR